MFNFIHENTYVLQSNWLRMCGLIFDILSWERTQVKLPKPQTKAKINH